MINNNEPEYADMSDEQFTDYCLKEAVKAAKITLRLNENCYKKFGRRMLSDVQKSYFDKIAAGMLPTDGEKAVFDVEAVKRASEGDKQRKAQQGAAFEPILTFEDKSDGYAVN